MELSLFLTETGVSDLHDDCIVPRKLWRKIDVTCGCRCCIFYNAIAFAQVSDISIFTRALNLRNTVREVRACLSCNPSERLCDGSQLMYFVCCSLSCQTMFRVVGDWLYSLSVVFGCDMNTKSLRLVETLFLLYQPRTVATQSSWLQLLQGDSHTASRPRWKMSHQ